MLRDKKGRQVHQQPRRPEREVPPSPVPTEREAQGLSQNFNRLPLPLFVSVSASLRFSVMLKLLRPTDNSVLFLTRLPTVWLYCTVYSPLTHFQR